MVIDFEENMNDTTDSVTNTTWDLENGIGIKGNKKGKTLRPCKLSGRLLVCLGRLFSQY